MDIMRTHDPDYWLGKVFSAKSATDGGVVRRSRHWVETEIGIERFEKAVRARGFHLLEAGQQLVVICHSDPVTVRF